MKPSNLESVSQELSCDTRTVERFVIKSLIRMNFSSPDRHALENCAKDFSRLGYDLGSKLEIKNSSKSYELETIVLNKISKNMYVSCQQGD